MHPIKRGLLFTLPILFFLSCTTNSDIFTEYYPIDNLYIELATEVDVEVINQEESTTAYSPQGLKVEIAPNSLVDGSGSTSTGDVLLTYQHLTEVSEYLKNGLNTQSQGLILNVRSMVYLSFEQEGERLLPTEATNDGVRLFVPISDPSKGNNLYEWSDNGWRLLSSNLEPSTFETNVDGASTTVEGYVINAQRASWVAIGSPLMNSDSESMLSVILPENHNSVNTVVYATLPGKTCLLSFEYDGEKAFFYTSVGGISTNEVLEIFSVTAQGEEDRYDFGTTSTQVDTEGTIQITPQPRNLDEITRYIDSL